MPMPEPRKSEWIRPSVAAEMLGVARGTVVYRAGQGRYATKRDRATGLTLVRRSDIEKDMPLVVAADSAADPAA